MLMFRIVAPRSLTRCVYITNKLFSPVKFLAQALLLEMISR